MKFKDLKVTYQITNERNEVIKTKTRIIYNTTEKTVINIIAEYESKLRVSINIIKLEALK